MPRVSTRGAEHARHPTPPNGLETALEPTVFARLAKGEPWQSHVCPQRILVRLLRAAPSQRRLREVLLPSLPNLRQRPRPLFGVGPLAVPRGAVLHERHALALDGVSDDNARAGRRRSRALQRLDDLVLVVAVDLLHLPAEGAPLIGERLLAHDVDDEAVVLDAVAVDDRREVGEAVVRRRHRRLPALALIQLAVAEEAVDAVVAPVEPRRQALADRGGKPLAERAARHLDAGDGPGLAVALQAAVQLAERKQLLEGEVAALGEEGVEHG